MFLLFNFFFQLYSVFVKYNKRMINYGEWMFDKYKLNNFYPTNKTKKKKKIVHHIKTMYSKKNVLVLQIIL